MCQQVVHIKILQLILKSIVDRYEVDQKQGKSEIIMLSWLLIVVRPVGMYPGDLYQAEMPATGKALYPGT